MFGKLTPLPLSLPIAVTAPTITVPPVDQDVSQGDSFTMTCSATGNGTISIQWEKDGLLLSNGVVMGNNLVFDEALPSHAGVYVCVASGEGGEARAEATVTVSCEFCNLAPLVCTNLCTHYWHCYSVDPTISDMAVLLICGPARELYLFIYWLRED